MQVLLDSRVINAFHDLLVVIDCEYTKFIENITVKKWGGGREFKTLIVQDSAWMNDEERVVNMIELKPIAKVWMIFLKSKLIPTTHTTIVSQDWLILLYALVKGLTKDVRKIIGKEIKRCVIKKQKTTALLFSSLIIGICKASGLKFEVSDKRVKNDSQDSRKDCLESIAAATPYCS